MVTRLLLALFLLMLGAPARATSDDNAPWYVISVPLRACVEMRNAFGPGFHQPFDLYYTIAKTFGERSVSAQYRKDRRAATITTSDGMSVYLIRGRAECDAMLPLMAQLHR